MAATTWWINASESAEHATEHGLLWAPARNKAGRSESSWTRVLEIKQGDGVLLWVSRKGIVALGVAVSDAVEGDKPEEYPDTRGPEGFRVDVSLSKLKRPIKRDDIPTSVRMGGGDGPFTVNGTVKFGYCFPFPHVSSVPELAPIERGVSLVHDAVRRREHERRSIAVYVDESGRSNLDFAKKEGWWGWKSASEDARMVTVGEQVVFAAGFPGGLPANPAIFRQGGFDEVLVGTVSEHVQENSEPVMPDELQGDEVLYPDRIRFSDVESLGELSCETFADRFGEDGLEAVRMSASHGGNAKLFGVGAPALLHVELQGSAPARSSAQTGLSVDAVARSGLPSAASAFVQAVVESGLRFGDDEEVFVRDFLVSAMTKRFVILTGLSGSGKTRLALALGQWFGESRHEIVAVRPDWSGPEPLLGYPNALLPSRDGQAAWDSPPALRFMLKAAADPSRAHLLILDEMNLAHVEQYFADVLSGMESREGVLPNLGRDDDGHWRQRTDPARLAMPNNLFIVGTVNVDETTYSFSPKVLDRANTVEFRVSTDALDETAEVSDVAEGSPADVAGILYGATEALLPDAPVSVVTHLRSLHRLLATHGREFGHRTFHEALRFARMLEVIDHGDADHATDVQILQKVLPRIAGSIRQVEGVLADIIDFCGDGEARFPLAKDKANRMLSRGKVDGYTAFAE